MFMCVFVFFFFRIRKALENKSNMEDDRVAALESQLAQAKQIAEEADKKYEEVSERAQVKNNYHIGGLLCTKLSDALPYLISHILSRREKKNIAKKGEMLDPLGLRTFFFFGPGKKKN